MGEELLRDADLVANVAVELGRLKDPQFLVVIGELRRQIIADAVTVEAIIAVQQSLNAAITDIAPISLSELRGGWTPGSVSRVNQVGLIAYALVAVLLMALAAF